MVRAVRMADSRSFNRLWGTEIEAMLSSPLDMVVTVDEAAAVPGGSRFPVPRMIKDGKIPARRTAKGIWLILRAGLPSGA